MSGSDGRHSIFLSNDDFQVVRSVALGYYEYGDNPNARELGKSSFQACLLGAMGELAAHRFYGVSWHPVFEPDGGADLILPGGSGRLWRANVKTTPYFNDPYLRVMDKLNRNCDIYVLVCASLDTGLAQMVGWISERKMQHAPLVNLRPDLPPCRVAQERHLEHCKPLAYAADSP